MRPHHHRMRFEGTAAHRQIAGSVGIPDDQRVLSARMALAIAVIIFAPCLAMPPSSASRPTMKPVTSAMNSSGILRLQQRSMKWVAFSAHSENSTPLLREDPDLEAHYAAKAGDQRLAIQRLEFVKLAAIDQPRNNPRLLVGIRGVRADQPINITGVEARLAVAPRSTVAWECHRDWRRYRG